MTVERPEGFFDLWQPLPMEKGNGCPSDQVLALAAKNKCPDEWTSHVQGCGQCRSVVETLRAAAKSPRRLEEFIEMAKAEAKKAAPAPRWPGLAALHRFVPTSTARWTAVAGGILALLLMTSWPFVGKYATWNQSDSVSTGQLEVDKYGKALQALQTAAEDAASARTFDPSTIARRKELHKLVRDAEAETSDASRLAQLNNAVVAYNQAWLKSQSSSGSTATVAGTRYSERLTDFYLAWGLSSQSNRPWSSAPKEHGLTAQERAEAIGSAIEQIQAVRIEGEPDQPTFVVQDWVQEWDPARRQVLTQAVEAFVARSNTNIRFKNGPFAQTIFRIPR